MIFRQEFDKNEYFVVKYFLKSKNYKYKIEDFYKKCNFKNKIYIIKNKTKNIKIKEKCKTIKLLKGIKQNIKVLIINK